MTDDLARKLGLTDSDIADLDRLCDLMADAPQPPADGPEDDPPAAGWERQRRLVLGCIGVITLVWIAALVVLAITTLAALSG